MTNTDVELAHAFQLEPHGPDTFVGESPPYPWGRIYGGLVIAQGLWAATLTVTAEHQLHSMHAYFMLAGDPNEPVRYEVDRLRNGRSFTTRQVVARQSGGAILTLSCSFQREEQGIQNQSSDFPSDAGDPQQLDQTWGAGLPRADVAVADSPPRCLTWTKYPVTLEDDPRKHLCALAYLSDVTPVSAIYKCHPERPTDRHERRQSFMSASLDHAMWFHRRARADEWILTDTHGHGIVGTRGVATGHMFAADGTHVATIAQEALLRRRKS
jgi:acyl-CoA thioesterase II